MAVYTKNGVKIGLAQVRALHPNISIPDDADLTALGYSKFQYSPEPVALPWHRTVPAIGADGVQVWSQVPMSSEEIVEACSNAVQAHLDAFARTRRYDDIKSATGYAGCAVPKFSAEGVYCRDIRAQVWAALAALMDDVQAGRKPMPASTEALIAALPGLVWPL
jgi:hypothetical protein